MAQGKRTAIRIAAILCLSCFSHGATALPLNDPAAATPGSSNNRSFPGIIGETAPATDPETTAEVPSIPEISSELTRSVSESPELGVGSTDGLELLEAADAPAVGSWLSATPRGESLEDVARALVNSAESRPSRRASPQQGNGREGGAGLSLIASFMSMELSPEVIQAIAQITTPSFDFRGAVSFSVFGMGDFAFTRSATPGLISLTDRSSGSTISINFGERLRPTPYNAAQRVHHTPVYSTEMSDRILQARDWLNDAATSPVTMIAAISIGLIAAFWKIAGYARRKKNPHRTASANPVKRARRKRRSRSSFRRSRETA